MGVFIGPGYGQVTIVMTSPGLLAPVVVTHGFRDVPGTALATAAAGAWGTALMAINRPLNAGQYSSSYTLDRIDATIGTATGPVLGTASYNQVGTAAYNPCPSNCAELVRKTSARGGRRGRGRNFWPPMHVDESNVGPSGTIAATQLAAAQLLFGGAFTALVATNYPPYLLHDFSEVAPDAVTGWGLQSRLATQRTRLRK